MATASAMKNTESVAVVEAVVIVIPGGIFSDYENYVDGFASPFQFKLSFTDISSPQQSS